MPTALVFGASGQIGAALLPRLIAAGWQVHALSRGPQAAMPGVTWHRGGFGSMPELPTGVDAIVSCGPLDAFGRWYADTAPDCPRVIAFGSTSVLVKHDSVDPAERDLAARLQGGEDAVFATAVRTGAAATLLRPTLVYGAGRDASLSRIAAIAERLGGFAIPADARGLRQPVHVDDLAAAAIAALHAPASHGRAYALGGGEALPYRQMLARTLACLQPPARLWTVPAPMFRAALAVAHALGRAKGFGPGALARLREDMVFDIAPAIRDLGYAPRPFRPQAAMFTPPARI